MKNSILLIVLLGIGLANVFGQSQGKVYVKQSSAEVFHYNKKLNSPWTGGMNCLQLTQGDLNNDGKKDIVAYDYINNIIFPYINFGSSSFPQYKYQEQFVSCFPALVNNYLLLKDYNGDQIPDLFYKDIAGFNVSFGKYVNNIIQFTYYKSLFYPGTFGPNNAYVAPGDVPAITDVDGDGDQDFVALDVLGNYIYYYKNNTKENAMPLDSIIINLESSCFGHVVQSSVQRTYQLNVQCKGITEPTTQYDAEMPNISAGDIEMAQANANYIKGQKKSRHSGNCLLLTDGDGDGDKDIFIGSVGFPEVQYLSNGGTSQSTNITYQDTTWQSNGTVLFNPVFITPSQADVNGDNKQDLIFGNHKEIDGLNFCNNDKLFYYQDTSTTNVPHYAYRGDSLLFDNTIDVGSYSYPTLFDFDKDGKLDLFVGSAGTLDTSSYKLTSRLSYYKNTSDTNSIRFELVSKDFLSIASKKYQGLYPHFADATGDGIADLLMGNNKGQVIVYQNNAADNMSTPNFVWLTDSFANIKVPGNYAAPCMFDINADNKLDIICGSKSGQLFYYENNGSSPISYSYLTGSLGNLTAGGNNFVFGYSAPIFAKLDSFKRDQLIIGNGDGVIERYDSILATTYGPYTRIDSFYSQIQTKERLTVAVGDLDKDGDNEMILGNKLGGLFFYQQALLLGTNDTLITPDNITTIIKNNDLFSVYPNPAKDFIVFENKSDDRNYTIAIYDATGKLVASKKMIATPTFQFPIAELASGIYNYTIATKNFYSNGVFRKD
jgi:hypothetical protein